MLDNSVVVVAVVVVVTPAVVMVVLVVLMAFFTVKFVSVTLALVFPAEDLTISVIFEVPEVAFLEPFVLSPPSGMMFVLSTKITSLSVDPLESFPGTS